VNGKIPAWSQLGPLQSFFAYIYPMRNSLWIGLCCLLFAACFQVRDVEPPASSSSDWISPSDYNILLGNYKRAIGQQNIQNYLRCLRPDGFLFVPSTPSYTGNELIWDNWTWQDEQTWFSNVKENLGLVSGNVLNLNQVDLQSVTADSLRYIGTYDLTMNHTDTSLTVRFLGQMELLCKVNAYNEWEIAKWTDIETHPDSSWSRLKLSYVQ
jgi:hypothetical protein